MAAGTITSKELCEMCNEYSTERKCDIKDSCELQKILQENKKLKEKNKKLKAKIDKLQSDLSWANDDNQMGRW